MSFRKIQTPEQQGWAWLDRDLKPDTADWILSLAIKKEQQDKREVFGNLLHRTCTRIADLGGGIGRPAFYKMYVDGDWQSLLISTPQPILNDHVPGTIRITTNKLSEETGPWLMQVSDYRLQLSDGTCAARHSLLVATAGNNGDRNWRIGHDDAPKIKSSVDGNVEVITGHTYEYGFAITELQPNSAILQELLQSMSGFVQSQAEPVSAVIPTQVRF